ncbi:MAG: metalloregulator ArsR/SmtB family transcription factor [Lewinellaceae bacterium]|nr:metalloregulator ArsR/SmtB family transcription factor [Lewinellaceae bacterium]
MEKRTFKNTIYAAIAGMTKAFSSPNRLEIIDLLANGEKTVEQIATQTAITVANASQHLQVLKTARLVRSRREGTFIFYSLNGLKSYAAWKALRDLAQEQEPAVQVTLQRFRQALGSPVQELRERLGELPRDKTIIAYCRGPFCTYADEAVQLLHANGFKALRLEESYLDIQLDYN